MGDILWFQLHLHLLFSQGIKGKQTKATISNVYVSTNQAPRTPYKYIQQSLRGHCSITLTQLFKDLLVIIAVMQSRIKKQMAAMPEQNCI